MFFRPLLLLCALPAWGCFLSKELSGKIDVYLKRCYCYGFSSKIECVDTLFNTAGMELLNKMCSSADCPHDILPPVSSHAVWICGSVLIDFFYHSILHKKSFVNYCFFKEL